MWTFSELNTGSQLLKPEEFFNMTMPEVTVVHSMRLAKR